VGLKAAHGNNNVIGVVGLHDRGLVMSMGLLFIERISHLATPTLVSRVGFLASMGASIDIEAVNESSKKPSDSFMLSDHGHIITEWGDIWTMFLQILQSGFLVLNSIKTIISHARITERQSF